MLRISYILFIAILICGCSSSLEKPSDNMDYGQIPINYKELIKGYFYEKLRDGETARYIFSTPVKAYENEGTLFGGEIIWKGWLVDVQINSKNGFGGYTGFEKYIVFFENGRIKKHRQGEDPILLKRLNER